MEEARKIKKKTLMQICRLPDLTQLCPTNKEHRKENDGICRSLSTCMVKKLMIYHRTHTAWLWETSSSGHTHTARNNSIDWDSR